MRPIVASVLAFALACGLCAADTLSASESVSIYNYAGHMTFTVADMPEPGEDGTTEVLEDFPLRIHIREDIAPGFGYALIKGGTKGFVFIDSTGRVLSHEIETWDTAGESVIWVKVPRMRLGTQITMCWGLRDGCPAQPVNAATNVWSSYVGVWHMDEEVDAAGAAAKTPAADATAHGHDLVPRIGPEGVYYTQTSTNGVFGRARVNDTATRWKKQGSFFEMSNTADLKLDGVFTLSFWLKFDAYANYPHLAARRSAALGNVGFQIDLNVSDRKQLVARGDTQTGGYNTIVDEEFKDLGFTHLAFVYDTTNVSIYANGVCKVDRMTIGKASDNGLPLVIGNKCDGKEQSVWGKYDEVRLYAGVKSAGWIAAEAAQTNAEFCSVGSLTNDTSAVLQNAWVREPTISQTVWETGAPTKDDFDLEPWHGTNVTFVIVNRGTGEAVTNSYENLKPPSAVGAYRVIVIVAPSGSEREGYWGALEYTLNYRIASHEGSHAFDVNVMRVLLGNDDYTVEGGEIEWQSYDDEDPDAGLPYWKHLDTDGNDASTTWDDYWSDSLDFNLGGGTHHIYRYGTGTDRLWDLRDVRIGNTFNNGEDLEERTGKVEEYTEGLAKDQNYLPWNPDSQRVLNMSCQKVEGYHRYAGHIVMQNTTKAAVTSTCYTNGIGTIYFDAVNGWTDNITNGLGEANYRLVVEIATNTTYDATLPPTERYVSSADVDEGIDAADRAAEPFYKANWVRWNDLRVLRFVGSQCEDLGHQSAVDLKITEGGNYDCFYRVIVPVNLVPKTGGIRFRIRRETIVPEQSLLPDGTAYILLDNVICSEPGSRIQLAPYGKYFPERTRLNNDVVQGWEGAFIPAFPSATDAQIYGRAKGTQPDGSPLAAGVVSAATMHYRWHYLEQRVTEWREADLDPGTLVSRDPLVLPAFEGDIEFWFDALQSGHYYKYADYTGRKLGLGDTGYTEEVPVVTNRAEGADWFVRMREGKSAYSDLRLIVRIPDTGATNDYPLTVAQDRLWRGYYRMTNTYENGIWWRIEGRNKQTDGATVWNWSTNHWYVQDWAEELPTFPAAGRLSEGTTNSWSRMPCNQETGYLMFQVDESSLGVTVIRADYQAFDRWNDAGKGYFTGSSTEETAKIGTSPEVREYSTVFGAWRDTPATNKYWSLDLNSETIDKGLYTGYKMFANFNNQITGWQIGKGQWVYGKYREPASHVALQMAGGTEGYAEFSNTGGMIGKWPRGVESVSFHARIAQTISPEFMAWNGIGVWSEAKISVYGYEYAYKYTQPVVALSNYTVMARACFDMTNNLAFAGNAALSLFAYRQNDGSSYEARWEQINGEVVTGNPNYSTEVNNPYPKGQRLILVRWNASGSNYKYTELIATTNKGQWNVNMPLMSTRAVTNNLMPFCMSVYHSEDDGATYITAAVRIKGGTGDASKDPGVGVSASDEIPAGDGNWYFVTYRDTSAERLKNGGSYGMLASNCEGLFVRPQFRAQPTWPSEIPNRLNVKTKNNYARQAAKTAAAEPAYVDNYDEMSSQYWVFNSGRMSPFYTPGAFMTGLHDKNFGFSFVRPDQTVDVLAKPKDSTTAWDAKTHRIGQVRITDFGQPGKQADRKPMFYYPSDSLVRLQTGGELNDGGSDVVIHDVDVRQWSGYTGWNDQEDAWEGDARTYEYHTNFVFTSGWVTNGAVQLSAKRTPADTPCSIRSPLLDGDYGNGVGLGAFRFSYREPQKNINLLVQIATNVTGSATLMKLTDSIETNGTGNASWHTVTNLTYADLWNPTIKSETQTSPKLSFAYHGAKGLMRVIVDPALVEQVAPLTWTNTALFGAIDITAVMCTDEPALDKGCWWGWNLQTIGDATDSQRRMYLPDGTMDVHYGQSLALNNSATLDVNPDESIDNFRKHTPFLQTPTFTNAVIGQISFKARKYETSEYAPAAKVMVYGAAQSLDDLMFDDQWTFIAEFTITNTLYKTYTCKTDSQNFYALRLVVVLPEGETDRPPEKAKEVTNPQRVMLDEVSISEAVRAMLSFCNVGAFRSNLQKNVYVPGVTTKDEQPLCDENWGVQAEVCATMLGDEIDTTYTPRVKLHWYVGTEPWGYSNWKKVETGSAWLAQTDGSNYVYRSSYEAAPAAIMPAQSEPGTVVQYMLEVVYRTINSSMPGEMPTKTLATNWLDSAAWKVPDWYAPLDYNNDPEYGAGRSFAAFNILDTVAPGWAWLNEANVFGTRSATGSNSDEQFQYVEVCVPMEADLSGWRLRMLDAYQNGTVITNWIAKFGKSVFDQAAAKKPNNLGAKYKKVFRCLGNKESDQLKKSDGTLDGVWAFSEYTSTFRNRGGVDCIADYEQPIGVQLVRPSGIIESSIVIVGTNRWGRAYPEYDPSNIVRVLNQSVPGSKFYYAAEDCRGTFRSGSVTTGQGESASVWTNDWACSPGYINTNWGGTVEQKIGDHPTPHGDSIIIYASVDLSGGPIRQWVGGKGSTLTNASEMIILPKDSVCGTNIFYQVEPWYEIAGITTNGVVYWYKPRVREHEITIGVGESNNITVVAKAGVDSDLRDKYGLTEANPFTPAVLDWLRGGTDAWGNPFKHDGEISLAEYWDMSNTFVTNLSLTQMYCLDIDPTVSNMLFKAGMMSAWPVIDHTKYSTNIVEGYVGNSAQTNVRTRVFMMISNKVENVSGPDGAWRAWSPYILRGLDSDFTSWDYAENTYARAWTSETFKVTGILANGLTRESNPENWVALRWFVFNKGSFAEDFTSTIEIVDPHTSASPGAAAGWYEWCQEHGYTPVFNSWSIDLKLKPYAIEVLQPTNFLSTATSD